MGLLELLKKIEDTYILNAPNIETMREFAYTAGYDVEYRYGFCMRWYNWICFNDCEYILGRNYKWHAWIHILRNRGIVENKITHMIDHNRIKQLSYNCKWLMEEMDQIHTAFVLVMSARCKIG